MIAGRKGKTIEFTISFDRADFHHLSGLHKLKDNIRIQTGQREAVMLDILAGKLTLPADSEECILRRDGAAPAPTFHAGTVFGQ